MRGSQYAARTRMLCSVVLESVRKKYNTSMYYVYILKSLKDGRTYTGYTSDIENRLRQHNAGQNISTKNRRPFILLHTEVYETIAQAKKRELWWKSTAGRNELKKMFT